MKHQAILFAALAAIPLAPAATRDQFVATLDGEHAVPAVITSAGGTANITIRGDSAIDYEIQVANLKDPWSAGIYTSDDHSRGFKAVTLFVGPREGTVNGVLAKGTARDQDLLGGAGANIKALAQDIRKGRAYVEVLTAAHPGGELRGKIIPAEQFEKRVALK